ncbi:acetolactate decarboxylase [Microbacterium sediminicola]|uniref:Alpha-acetolactate decarboxylase n=1 Tax=Microbacterium sediminicola TaxID=415210 RepID=A0ABP4U8U5_9MICO
MKASRHTIYQTGVMAALLDGVYDGETTVSTLLSRGDFGIGTFDGLDGEMVILDGVCYRLRDDGSAAVAAPSDLTPYAVVTTFAPHTGFDIDAPTPRAALLQRIDTAIASANYMYAVRVDGVFSSMRVRAVHVQQRPYRPLVAATDEETVTELTDVEGTIVGFRSPAFEEGLAVPGYHAHFLTTDRRSGGHVLDHELRHGTVSLCVGTDLHLELPQSAPFAQAHLDPDDLREQVTRAENAPPTPRE